MSQYLYGKNIVYNLLAEKKDIEALYIQSNRNNNDVEFLAKRNGVKCQIVDRKFLDSLVNGNHQGFVAKVQDYKVYDIDELLETVNNDAPLLVALDSLEDPHNLGAILRTSAAIGVDGVIIEKNRSVSLNGTVAKVSSTGIEKVKVASVTNLTKTLDYLKTKGYWVVGTDFDGQDYRAIKYDMPIVLVIGSEGKGMHRLVKESCDIIATLPMTNGMESLNASVAAGIMLYQIHNNRNPL